MKASPMFLGLALLQALPAAFAGTAADPHPEGATGAKTSAKAPMLCGQRCRHELQGRAALNYVATPRPQARD